MFFTGWCCIWSYSWCCCDFWSFGAGSFRTSNWHRHCEFVILNSNTIKTWRCTKIYINYDLHFLMCTICAYLYPNLFTKKRKRKKAKNKTLKYFGLKKLNIFKCHILCTKQVIKGEKTQCQQGGKFIFDLSNRRNFYS